jgi:transcriptional regulator
MHNPPLHEETRLDILHALIRTYPLGAWVMLGDGELLANHIPFLLDPTRGEFGTLVGHVARANPVWKTSAQPIPSTIIFQGPQTYISPSWYPSKHEHGKVVPTWNYAVVHAQGQPRYIDDHHWLFEQLGKLTDTHEASQALPWKIDDAPRDFTDTLMSAIVGVEIPIQRIAGKWKTNQNRSDADKLGVVAGLLTKGDQQSTAMAALVRQHTDSPL